MTQGGKEEKDSGRAGVKSQQDDSSSNKDTHDRQAGIRFEIWKDRESGFFWVLLTIVKSAEMEKEEEGDGRAVLTMAATRGRSVSSSQFLNYQSLWRCPSHDLLLAMNCCKSKGDQGYLGGDHVSRWRCFGSDHISLI